MIDKNGKMFGKINIIDLLIILVVIAALIFAAVKVFAHESSGGEDKTSKVQLGFFSAEVEQGFENVFYKGAPLYEDLTNVPLGELTDWTIENEYEYQVNADGESVKVEHPNKHFITVTAEASGTLASDGLHIGSSIYCVGAHYTIHVGTGKLYVECREITPLD